MGVIARQTIKGAIANYIGIAVGFLTTFFVLTRCLTEAEVGMTRMMVDAATLFSSLAMLGTNSSLVRYFPYFKDGRGNHGIFGWSVVVPLTGLAVMVLLFVLLRTQLTEVYAGRSPLLAQYLYMLPMLTAFMMYTTVFETNASVLMRITVPKMVREIGIRVMNLAAYLLYGTHVISFTTFVWLFCGSYAVAMLLNLFYLFKLGHISLRIEKAFPGKAMLKEMGGYSLLMTATVLAGNVPMMNSLFLGAKAGAALTGVYAIASYVANVVEVPYRSLGAISRPVVSQAMKDGDRREVNRLVRQVSLHQMLVSLLIFYIIWINIDAFFSLLPEGEHYRAGAIVVLVLGLAKVVNSSLSIGTDVLNFSRHYRMGLVFIAVLTGTAIALNATLIGRWGIGGSAAATLVAYAVYFSLLLTYVWIRERVSLFSWGHLKTAVMIAALFALAAAWKQWVAPIVGNMLVDALLKTAVLGALAAVVTYRWKISPSVNNIIDKYLHKQNRQ